MRACTHIYIVYIYIHAYTRSCAWHTQSSSLDDLGRGTLVTYAVESAEADCLPTAADRLAYPSEDAPLFVLVMTTSLRDAGALYDASKSKNHCQKPRLSPRSIFWNRSRNQEYFFLFILVFYLLQRPLTLPSWANLPVIAKSMSCHEYKIQVWTLQWHTQTGINTHRKQEDDDQHSDSTLKNPTPSIHHQHSSPPTLVSLLFRLSVTRNTGRPRRRCTLYWFRPEEVYTISETHKTQRPLHFLDLYLCTTLSPPLKASFRKEKIGMHTLLCLLCHRINLPPSLLTHGHRCIGPRNTTRANPMDQPVRLMYLSVSDSASEPVPFPSPHSSHKHSLRCGSVQTTQPTLWINRWDWCILLHIRVYLMVCTNPHPLCPRTSRSHIHSGSSVHTTQPVPWICTPVRLMYLRVFDSST
jgi:hypothetical protein